MSPNPKRRLWTADNVHISGVAQSALSAAGADLSPSGIVREINTGREVPTALAQRALAKNGDRARPGEVWIADPRGEGLYVLCEGRGCDRKAWTLMGWFRLSEFGRAVVAA